MALMLEAVDAAGATQRFPIQTGRNQFAAQPGMRYRIIDDSGASVGNEATVKRIGNDLVIEDLSDKRVVELDEFFARCTPEASCTLATDNLGGVTGSEITPVSQPVAALNDGSFIMVPSSAVQTTSLAEATTGVSTTAKAVGIGLGVLGLAAAGGGGGGGGGGGNVEPPPATQPVKMNALAITNDTTPVISGTGTPGSGMLLTVSGNGVTVAYNIVVGADGNWTLDTGAATPASGSLPAGGLTQGNYSVSYRVIVNNAPVEGTFEQSIAIDTTPPGMPIISSPAGGTVVNAAAAVAGVTFSGSAETGSTVRVSWVGMTETVATDASGHWTATFKGDQVNGSGDHRIATANAIDPAGNISQGATVDIVLQTGRPAAATLDPVTGNDIVNSIERAAGVVLHGSTSPNVTVEVSWGTSRLTTTSDAGGVWSLTIPAGQVPPDGTTQIQMTATDSAGNTTASSHAVLVDTTSPGAPTIASIPENAGGGINAVEAADGTSVVISLTGTGAVVNDTLTVRWGSQTLTRTVSAAEIESGSVTFSIPPSAITAAGQGTIAVTASLTDQAGNPPGPNSAAASVYVDTIAPNAPSISSIPENSGGGISAAEAADGTPVVVSLAGSGALAGDSLIVHWGSQNITRVLTSGDISAGSATVTVPLSAITAAGQGNISVTASVTDQVGNPPSPNSAAVGVFVDTVAPTQTVSIATYTDDVAPGVGNFPSGTPTNDTTPVLNGTLSAALGSGEVLRIYDGGTFIGTATVSGTNWTFATPTLTVGSSHSYTAQVVDGLGNTGSVSPAFALTVSAPPTQTVTINSYADDVAPQIGASYPSGSSTNDATPTLNGTISAALSAGQSVHVYLGSTDLGAASVTGTSWTLTLPTQSEGPHTYTARVENSAGQTGASSAAFTLTVDTVAPAQIVTISTYTDNVGSVVGDFGSGVPTDDTTPVLNGTLTATLDPGDRLFVYESGTQVGQASVSGLNWTFAPSTLAAGTHTYTARVVDAAGNPGAASSGFVINVSAAPTQTTAINEYVDNVGSIQGTFGTGTLTDDTSPLLQGSVSAALTAGQAVRVYQDGTLLAGDAMVSGTSWSYQLTGVSLASHTYTAVVTDTSGATGTTSPAFSLTVVGTPTQTTTISSFTDNVLPVTGSTLPSGSVTNDTTPELHGTISAALTAGQSVHVFEGATDRGAAAVSGLTWSLTLPTIATQGPHSYTAQVVSDAGPTGTASSAFTLTLDTVAPTQTYSYYSIIDDTSGLPGGTLILEGGTTTDTTPTINITLNSVLGTGEVLHLSRNGTEISSALSGNSMTYTDTVAPSGTPYTYSATITDAAGNLSTLFTQHFTVTT